MMLRSEPENPMNARSPITLAPQEAVAVLTRRAEILFNLSFHLGGKWRSLDSLETSNIMDVLDGSRGLFDHVEGWTAQFDQEWEARAEEDKEDFLNDVDVFCDKQFEELREWCAEEMKRRAQVKAFKPLPNKADRSPPICNTPPFHVDI
jgi:hypothetical protein